MIEKITKRINDDLKQHIESDAYKVENDLMMLKHLLGKYPDFKSEDIQQQKPTANEEKREERKEEA